MLNPATASATAMPPNAIIGGVLQQLGGLNQAIQGGGWQQGIPYQDQSKYQQQMQALQQQSEEARRRDHAMREALKAQYENQHPPKKPKTYFVWGEFDE